MDALVTFPGTSVSTHLFCPFLKTWKEPLKPLVVFDIDILRKLLEIVDPIPHKLKEQDQRLAGFASSWGFLLDDMKTLD